MELKMHDEMQNLRIPGKEKTKTAVFDVNENEYFWMFRRRLKNKNAQK